MPRPTRCAPGGGPGTDSPQFPSAVSGGFLGRTFLSAQAAQAPPASPARSRQRHKGHGGFAGQRASAVSPGERIQVAWEDGKFYAGVVSVVRPSGDVAGVYYDGGSFEWVELNKVGWKKAAATGAAR
jgi:hypothetical protein